jgi:non-homologous end joining protein Ku
MPRSIWNGAVSVAGVDVPIKVYGAAEPQGVQFRELHVRDGGKTLDVEHFVPREQIDPDV